MGVMSCYRKDCENILCDRYSVKYGYLCHSCFGKLVKLGPQTNVAEFMESSVHDDIDEEASQAYFEHIFPD